MPTITVTPVAAAVEAVSYMTEHRVATEQGALRAIVDLMVDTRDALVPIYNEVNADNRANAEDPSKVADINAAAFNIAMVTKARLEKLVWKHSAETIREILWDVELHDEDRLGAFQLWAVGEQGTDKEGNPNAPAAQTWQGYMKWLKQGMSLGTYNDKGQLTSFGYTKLGKQTTAAKALQAKREKDADDAKRRQLTGTNYVPDTLTSFAVIDLLNMQHDVNRAVLLVKEQLTSTPEGKKVWSTATRKVTAARNGK